MNNRWNPDILDTEDYCDEENQFDFGNDGPNEDAYIRHRNRLGVYAVFISLGITVFLVGMLFGVATMIDALQGK